MPLPARHLTCSVFSSFKPWEQQILSRHVTGAFMCGQQKATWSRVEDGLCPLCGQEDTKEHRLYTCDAMADLRRGNEDLLAQVRQEHSHWPHLLYASEHADQFMLRLLAQTRQLPPLCPWPASALSVTVFTDGAAHHSAIPPARLTYWAVVLAGLSIGPTLFQDWDRLDVRARTARFRVLCQGAPLADRPLPGQNWRQLHGFAAGLARLLMSGWSFLRTASMLWTRAFLWSDTGCTNQPRPGR